MNDIFLILIGAIGGASAYRLAIRISEFCHQVDEAHRLTGPATEVFTSPEAIDAAKQWVGTKVDTTDDAAHAVLIIEILYRWQLKLLKAKA